MGGRIAEEIVFGYDKVTSGASSDIEQATKLARAMVTKFGMSDVMGPLSYGENEEEIFLGHSVARTQSVSEETSAKIDAEVRRFVDECYARAHKILTDGLDDLHNVAKALLEFETLTGDEIVGLLKGQPVHRSTSEDDETTGNAPAESAVPTSGEAPGGLKPEPQPGS